MTFDSGVVHIICAQLREDATSGPADAAIELAHGLRDAPGVRHVIVGRSERALAAVTWLQGRDALEPFAASPEHMAFVMRGLAPCVRGMWSAAIESDQPPPAESGALWVFGLREADSIFEWQVRALVEAVEALPGAAAAGPTIEERERYRAGGCVCVAHTDIETLRTAIVDAAARQWVDLGAQIDEEMLDIVPGSAGA